MKRYPPLNTNTPPRPLNHRPVTFLTLQSVVAWKSCCSLEATRSHFTSVSFVSRITPLSFLPGPPWGSRNGAVHLHVVHELGHVAVRPKVMGLSWGARGSGGPRRTLDHPCLYTLSAIIQDVPQQTLSLDVIGHFHRHAGVVQMLRPSAGVSLSVAGVLRVAVAWLTAIPLLPWEARGPWDSWGPDD